MRIQQHFGGEAVARIFDPPHGDWPKRCMRVAALGAAHEDRPKQWSTFDPLHEDRRVRTSSSLVWREDRDVSAHDGSCGAGGLRSGTTWRGA